ncbi:glycerophosphodiester phosphodiesterase family protein [bacterium]|nr:glycerophosphodiester phosphodiesterase family protein [bacterium]
MSPIGLDGFGSPRIICAQENSGQDQPVRTLDRAGEILQRFKHPSDDYILVVSHRGDWRYAPENSLVAIQRCIDLGVDIIELDFRLTKDGHLVAMHDKTVDRTTDGSGKVSEMTLAEIKALRLKSGCGIRGSSQQVPTLEEVMNLVKGKVLVNLDKTESKWVREAYTVLEKTGTVEQAIFKGNDTVAVMMTKYGDLMHRIIYMPKLYENPDLEEFVAAYEKQLNPFAYEMLFDSEASKVFQMIPTMKKNGNAFLAIALWDELCAGRTDELKLLKGADQSWGWLIEKGANAIMTDRPEELLLYLRQKGLHD